MVTHLLRRKGAAGRPKKNPGFWPGFLNEIALNQAA
jgi:hypothetical protein